MMTKAYICYEDGSPSEAQTFTSCDELLKALKDAFDMFETHDSNSSDLKVREFHCTFGVPKYKKQKTWDKFDERNYKAEKTKMNKEIEQQYKIVKPMLNYCSNNCNKKCKSAKKCGYYDSSMSEFCEHDFEV